MSLRAQKCRLSVPYRQVNQVVKGQKQAGPYPYILDLLSSPLPLLPTHSPFKKSMLQSPQLYSSSPKTHHWKPDLKKDFPRSSFSSAPTSTFTQLLSPWCLSIHSSIYHLLTLMHHPLTHSSHFSFSPFF